MVEGETSPSLRCSMGRVTCSAASAAAVKVEMLHFVEAICVGRYPADGLPTWTRNATGLTFELDCVTSLRGSVSGYYGHAHIGRMEHVS
jgi:hypothetical protein